MKHYMKHCSEHLLGFAFFGIEFLKRDSLPSGKHLLLFTPKFESGTWYLVLVWPWKQI